MAINNFERSLVVSGTTNSTADTSQVFIHNAKAIPKRWVASGGDVYVPIGGIGMNTIDVRSHQTSMKFSITLYF